MDNSKPARKYSRGRLLWGLALLLAWSGVLYIFLKSNGGLTVQDLLRYRPNNPLLAALAMCGLFALKSVDFLLYAGILYAADGIMFSLPAALLLNTFGALIMSLIPYFVGRSLGQPVLQRLAERYPRFQVVEKIHSQNQMIITLMVRLIGLPLAGVGIYMGAAQFRFDRYALGSVLGMLPLVVCATVMGVNVRDRSSPAFWVALGFQLITMLLSLLIYTILQRRSR